MRSSHSISAMIWSTCIRHNIQQKGGGQFGTASPKDRDCGNSSNCNDHAPRFNGMLDQLMGACYLIQGDNFGDVKPLPSRL